MKKGIGLLLVILCCAALFAGCAANKPQEPAGTEPSSVPDPAGTEPSAAPLPAERLDLEAILKELAAQHPNDTAEALAERLLENPYFKMFVVETQDLTNSEMAYLPARD